MSSFLGREVELDALLQDFRACMGGQDGQRTPQMTVIVADSGIGKTRLMQEMYRRLAQDEHWNAAKYWPATLEDDATAPVIPEDYKPAGPPEFIWLGGNVQNVSIAEVTDQIKAHVRVLEKNSPIWQKLLRGGKLDADTVTEEGLGIALDLVGAAFPFAPLLVRSVGSKAIDASRTFCREHGLLRDHLEVAPVSVSKELLRMLSGIFATDHPIPMVLWLDNAQDVNAENAEFLEVLWQRAVEYHWPLHIVVTHWAQEWHQGTALSSFLDASKTRYLSLSPSSPDILGDYVRQQLPNLTPAQNRLLVEKAGGNFKSMLENIAHLCEEPANFVDHDPNQALNAMGEAEVQSWESERDRLVKQRFSSLTHLKEILGWCSRIGQRFMQDIVQEFTRQSGRDTDVATRLQSCVQPHLVLTDILHEGHPHLRLKEFRDAAYLRAARHYYQKYQAANDEALLQSTIRQHLQSWITNSLDSVSQLPLETLGDAPCLQQLSLPELRGFMAQASGEFPLPQSLAVDNAEHVLALQLHLLAVHCYQQLNAWPELHALCEAWAKLDWAKLTGLLPFTALSNIVDIAERAGWTSLQQPLAEQLLGYALQLQQLQPGTDSQDELADSYMRLGDAERQAGNLKAAHQHQQAAFEIRQTLAEQLQTPESQFDLAWSYERLGDIAQRAGDTDQARQHYENYHSILQRLIHDEPDNWQHSLSISYDRIGTIQQAQGDLSGALASYRNSLNIAEKLANLDPANSQWQRDLSISYNNIGDIQQAQGDLSEALLSFRNSLTIAEELARLDPVNSEWQRDLSISYDNIGDIQQARGDLPGALVSFRKYFEIAEKLARLDPANSQWQSDLAWAQTKIGNIQQAQGDLTGALVSFRNSLTIRDKLARLDPANSQWQRDLSISYDNIGNIQQAQGDLPGALASFRKLVEGAEKLARLDPANSQWQRDLSVSYNNIGDIQQAQGDLSGALASYRNSLTISEELARLDPANSEWQHNLSISYDNIGDIQQAQDDLLGARASYRNSLTIREKLARLDPTNSKWQHNLSVSYDRIGNIQQAQGDLPGALVSFRKLMEGTEELARLDPTNSEWQRNLSLSYDRIGNIQQAQGDLPGALASYRNSLTIAEELARLDPANGLWQRDLSISYGKIGDIQQAQGDLPGALVSFRKLMEGTEKLAHLDPTNSEWQRNLSVSYGRVGDIQRAQGDSSGALVSFRYSHDIFEKLSLLDTTNVQWQRDLSISYEKIGNIQQAQGDLPGALLSFRNSLFIMETLARLDPANGEWQRDLSVSYEKVGNIQQAQGDLPGMLVSFRNSLDILEGLVRLDSSNQQWQRELGETYFFISRVLRNQKEWDAALSALLGCLQAREKLIQLDDQNMAYWQDFVFACYVLQKFSACADFNQAWQHYQPLKRLGLGYMFKQNWRNRLKKWRNFFKWHTW